MTYRFLPHTADILVEFESPTLAGLFADATQMLARLLAGDSIVARRESHMVSLTAGGPDELLHHYMWELLTLFQVKTFVPAGVELDELHTTSLVGTVSGEKFDERRHETQPEVKAVTRHGLAVEQTDSGWRGSMVLDM
jgi:SHS2 domain-containing protein